MQQQGWAENAKINIFFVIKISWKLNVFHLFLFYQIKVI